MSTHKLLGDTLYIERGGIIGRCSCGWDTGHRISGMIASNAFNDHVESAPADSEYYIKQIHDKAREYRFHVYRRMPEGVPDQMVCQEGSYEEAKAKITAHTITPTRTGEK
jgi:NMD protein affecting ribosome stability and mRNA decay